MSKLKVKLLIDFIWICTYLSRKKKITTENNYVHAWVICRYFLKNSLTWLLSWIILAEVKTFFFKWCRHQDNGRILSKCDTRYKDQITIDSLAYLVLFVQCIDIYMYLCGCVTPYIMLSKKVVRVCCFVNKAIQFCEQINALDASPFIQQQTLLIQNQ